MAEKIHDRKNPGTTFCVYTNYASDVDGDYTYFIGEEVTSFDNIDKPKFGSIYTDQLWVHPEHRGKGLGHKLMAQVHDYGRENDCAMATVATMSFQGAKAFYEKLGYVVDFERAGYTQNSSCIFLNRSL